MKRSFLSVVLIVIVGFAFFFNSCVDPEPDEPAVSTIPFDPDKVLTIGQIKDILVDSGGTYTFKDNYSFRAVVVMDEKSGNIYKTSIVQDETGGIQMNLFNPGGLYEGDSIQVLLNKTTIESYHQLVQIQNVDVGKAILKIATGKFIEPKVLTVQEFNLNTDYYQSTLIQFDSVQFKISELTGKTYADSANLETEERTLEDCNGKDTKVRTSGYANFANQVLPKGKGPLIAIGSVYDEESQLTLRTTDEVQLNGLRCDGSNGNIIFFEGFDDGLINWDNISIEGDQVWELSTSYGNPQPCAVITGYSQGSHQNDDWLISPSIDMSNYSIVYLSIETAKFYSGNVLEVLISNDYDNSGNPNTGNWTALQVPLSPGLNWDWIPSGLVDISNFIGPKVWIAFRYTSTNSQSATYELDNVLISYDEE